MNEAAPRKNAKAPNGARGENGRGLDLDSVSRSFSQGESALEVLKSVSLHVTPGEMVALVGPSGAGKSTLLHIAGLLDSPDSGEVWVNGKAAAKLNDAGRTALRRTAMGFVYQYHHLLPEFSAKENIVLPQMLTGVTKAQAEERAMELLGMVKLADRADHRPGQLSGGEQQRVAIARALANRPAILLADEPTGNLDPETAESVFSILVRLVHETGLAALIATHNLDLAARMDRTLRCENGKVF